MATILRFRSTVERRSSRATALRLPSEVRRHLGGGRPRVMVDLGGHRYRSTVHDQGGVPMLPLGAADRAATGLGPGDEVEVHLMLDTGRAWPRR